MTSADRILQRLLLVLPEAQADGGAEVGGLAEALGVEPRRILRDLGELQSRTYYLPAGLGDQIQLQVTRDRLTAWTTGEFQRPVRLNPREAMALELGLRILARRDGEADVDDLRARLIRPLQVEPPSSGGSDPGRTAGAGQAHRDPSFGLGDLEEPTDGIEAAVHAAVETRRELEIVYRPLGRDPGERRVAPLLLAHAEGRWYLLARDLSDQGARAFRLDRILTAEPTGHAFSPTDGDAEAVERFLGDGRVHDGGTGSETATVRYSERIARWIREHPRGDIEELDDGSVRVRHQVSDREWMIRHVLGYGPDARAIEPEWLRSGVAEAAMRLSTR